MDSEENLNRNSESNERFVVAYRGDPRGILTFYIILFSTLLIGSPLNTIIAIRSKLWVLLSIAPIELFLIIVLICKFIQVGINSKNHNECLIFDYETRNFIAYTISEKEVIIKDKDFIAVKDNFSSDFILKLTYRLPNGKNKKLSLGYCENRQTLMERLDKVLR